MARHGRELLRGDLTQCEGMGEVRWPGEIFESESQQR